MTEGSDVVTRCRYVDGAKSSLPRATTLNFVQRADSFFTFRVVLFSVRTCALYCSIMHRGIRIQFLRFCGRLCEFEFGMYKVSPKKNIQIRFKNQT